MKRVQQKSVYYGDCGVACVAMLAGCTYEHAFNALGFNDEHGEYYYTRHFHLFDALNRLGFIVQRKHFCSWNDVGGHAIVAVNHTQYGYWHWVAFDGSAILDPKPNRPGRKTDFRGLKGRGIYFSMMKPL